MEDEGLHFVVATGGPQGFWSMQRYGLNFETEDLQLGFQFQTTRTCLVFQISFDMVKIGLPIRLYHTMYKNPASL